MKIKQMLTNNLFLKILSLGAAVVLWIVVLTISDAEDVERYNLEVTLLNTDVITENGKVFRVEDGTNMVKLTVRERRSVLADLKSTDFTLTADMEKDLKYDSLVTIRVECKNRDIDVDKEVSLGVSNVKVSIEEAATEQFQVHVDSAGEPNNGFVVGKLEAEQSVIKITGPVSIVEKIKKVEAIVDVTGLQSSTVKNCSLQITDGDGDLIDTTYLDYTGKSEGMNVRVSMLKSKTVPLMFNSTGTPAEGYEISDISWKPETVRIAGSEGVLGGISWIEIPAEAINVEGIEDELQLVVDLKEYLPSGVILADEDEATVLVIVEVKKVDEEDPEPTPSPSVTDKPTPEPTAAATASPTPEPTEDITESPTPAAEDTSADEEELTEE